MRFNGLKFLKQQVICEWVPIFKLNHSRHLSKEKELYLIRDNLLTDDEGEHFNKNSKNSIIVEKVENDIPINSLKLSEENSNQVESCIRGKSCS